MVSKRYDRTICPGRDKRHIITTVLLIRLVQRRIHGRPPAPALKEGSMRVAMVGQILVMLAVLMLPALVANLVN